MKTKLFNCIIVLILTSFTMVYAISFPNPFIHQPHYSKANNFLFTNSSEETSLDTDTAKTQIVLKDGVSFEEQVKNRKNTIFVVSHDYFLNNNNGKPVSLPDNCTLDFRGGRLIGGSIVGNNTTLRGDVLFKNFQSPLSGSFTNKNLESNWFGFQKDGRNEDALWNLFIQSGLNTGCTLFVNKGNYSVYSMLKINALPGFTIIGDNNENTVIQSCCPEDMPLFFVANAGDLGTKYAKIANLKLVRKSSLRHSGTGIRLGNYESNRVLGHAVTCSHITLENLAVSNFRIGVDYNRTWNNITKNIKVTGNYYGLFSCCTTVNISDVWIQNNIVGVYQPHYEWGGNIAISNGNIEYNVIGILIESGSGSFYNCYLENNKPTENNLGFGTELASQYPEGAECVAGKNKEEVVSLSFINCVSGRSASNTSSLYDFDNIANLSIIGSNIENVISTPNTRFSVITAPTTDWFGNSYKEYVRAYTSPDYALAEDPILFFDDFSKWSCNKQKKSYFSDGVLCSAESKSGNLVVKGKSLVRTLTSEDDSYSFQVSIPASYFSADANVTFRVRYRLGNRVKILDIADSRGRKRIRKEKNVYNDDCIHEVDIDAKKAEGVYYTRFNVNGINNKERNKEEFFYEIVSIAVFDGYATPSKRITKWSNVINSKDIVVAKKALAIPTVNSEEIPYIKGNFMYFDNGKRMIVVKDEKGVEHYFEEAETKAARSGTFAKKPAPSEIYVGFRYFCTDKQTKEGKRNGIEIIWNGSEWVDALGRVISDR